MLYISDADPLGFRQTRISALPTPEKQPTTHRYDVVSKMARCRRLWANIETTLDKRQPGAPPTPEKKHQKKQNVDLIVSQKGTQN